MQYYDELLQRHPDWELVDRYIDEGITGTSIHKRDGDISREVFRSKKKKLEDQISNIEKINSECRQQILELEDNEAKDRRIESLSEFIKMTAYDARAKIPETVIDNFVDRVVFDHGDFIWYLNPTFGNEVYSQSTSD